MTGLPTKKAPDLKFTAFDSFILRTPATPTHDIDKIPDDLGNFFKSLLNNHLFCLSIFIASPELYDRVEKLKRGELLSEKDNDRLISTLLRYWLRASSRSTPYGAFAGCAVGNIGSCTDITLGKREDHHLYNRLDMGYINQLVAYVESLEKVKYQLTYFTNTSLYQIGDKYRYLEYRLEGVERKYEISEVDASSELSSILVRAQRGSSIHELTSLVANDEIPVEEAQSFVEQLIESQLLMSELTPSATNGDCFDELLRKMRRLYGIESTLHDLLNVQSILKADTNEIFIYRGIQDTLAKLLGENGGKDFIQTDLYLSTKEINIGKSVIESIVADFSKLLKISPTIKEDRIKHFIEKFIERYGDGERPLLNVLDANDGIGYGLFTNGSSDMPPILSELPFEEANSEVMIKWGKAERFRLRKYNEAIKSGDIEIQLSDADLEELQQNNGRLVPDSMSVMGSLLGESCQAVDRGEFKFLYGTFTGPSAATLLGRFCNGNSELNKKVADYLTDEESRHPESIFAEIAHLPQPRLGNIIVRPSLRQFEIPYFSCPKESTDNQILASDIWVSVAGGKIRLRSKKLSKEIIPRLSSAHNFRSNTLPLYQFLCDVQMQGAPSGVLWDWGVLSTVSFLPRVTYGHIIICKARWMIDRDDFSEALTKSNTDVGAFFSDLRVKRRLPRFVVLSEGDNEIPMDLDNSHCQTILWRTLKRHSLTLSEYLTGPTNCIIQDENGGRYTNEIIIPLRRIGEERTTQKPQVIKAGNNIQRTFVVGSEWLYFKIYCGVKTADRILFDFFAPLIQRLQADNMIDSWFFIRYGDPDSHLRVRFKGKGGFWSKVVDEVVQLTSQSVENGLIHRIQCDTYEREIERYGVKTMELSERLFWRDSQCVLEYVNLVEAEEINDSRDSFAMIGVDRLMDDFGFEIQERALLIGKIRDSFLVEFNAEKSMIRKLDLKYRERMKTITMCLDNEGTSDEISVFNKITSTRSANTKPIIEEIKKRIYDPDGDKAWLHSFVGSHIHMFLNRLFTSNHRKQEMVIYYFLNKAYTSKLAMEKKRKTENSLIA